MCGIAGILSRTQNDRSAIHRMMRSQHHRGPDGEGVYTDRGLTLGHRRLQILDLSDRARQPMASSSGRYWISYNGEIYNYIELAEQLKALGREFRTTTDTEVILEAYEEWGQEALPRLRGMFAFAIWDSQRRTLDLVRDPFGIKPLVYYRGTDFLAFASEEKGLLAHGGIPRILDRSSVFDFLATGYGYVNTDSRTFFRGVESLRPGQVLTATESGELNERCYVDGTPEDRPSSYGAFIEGIQERVSEAIRFCLRSDVPVGCALSGGVDSSAVTVLASRASSTPLVAASVSFREPGIDETPYMSEVTNVIRSPWRECTVKDSEVPQLLESAVWHLDRPYAGPSICAQWMLMKTFRSSGVIVALNGQGGDEIFAGYKKFYSAMLASAVLGGQPLLAGQTLSEASHANVPALRNAIRLTGRFLFPHLRGKQSIDPAVHSELATRHAGAALERVRPLHTRPLQSALEYSRRVSPLPSLLWNDDRLSMAHGVESRPPLLDLSLVRYVASVPDLWLTRKGVLKGAFRDALRGVVPAAVLERRDKLGFPTPVARWLRGPLKQPLQERLRSKFFTDFDLLRPEVAQRRISEHMEEQQDHGYQLFSWLSLAVFLDQHFS